MLSDLLGLEQDGNDSIVLIACQFVRIFDQTVVEVLLACLFVSVVVLVELHFFVELLCVDFGNILNHDCDIFGVELALRPIDLTSNLGL